MGFVSLSTTVSIILLFSLDIATDVATGVELVLNDNPYCEFSVVGLFGLFAVRLVVILICSLGASFCVRKGEDGSLFLMSLCYCYVG